jgi:hypothetical protein
MGRILITFLALFYLFGLSDAGLCNEPPAFIDCPVYMIVGTGNRLIHDFIAVDPDGDSLIYGIQSDAYWPGINPFTGRVDGRPGPPDIGYWTVTVSATDGIETDYCSFGLEVVSCGDIKFMLEG